MEKAPLPHSLHLYSNGHFYDDVKKNTGEVRSLFFVLGLFRPEFYIAAVLKGF